MTGLQITSRVTLGVFVSPTSPPPYPRRKKCIIFVNKINSNIPGYFFFLPAIGVNIYLKIFLFIFYFLRVRRKQKSLKPGITTPGLGPTKFAHNDKAIFLELG